MKNKEVSMTFSGLIPDLSMRRPDDVGGASAPVLSDALNQKEKRLWLCLLHNFRNFTQESRINNESNTSTYLTLSI